MRGTTHLASIAFFLIGTPVLAQDTVRFTPTVGHPTFAVREPVMHIQPGTVLISNTMFGPYYTEQGGAFPGEVGPFYIDGATTNDMGISGSDILGISGSDAQLLVYGAIEHVGDGFISVLGQTVFGSGRGLRIGTRIAVFGSIDSGTGGIVDAQVFAVRARMGSASYLRGRVDEVNLAFGRAVVSGVTVDYNALLSNGRAPIVGDTVSVTGRAYGGLIVADPSLGFD